MDEQDSVAAGVAGGGGVDLPGAGGGRRLGLGVDETHEATYNPDSGWSPYREMSRG